MTFIILLIIFNFVIMVLGLIPAWINAVIAILCALSIIVEDVKDIRRN